VGIHGPRFGTGHWAPSTYSRKALAQASYFDVGIAEQHAVTMAAAWPPPALKARWWRFYSTFPGKRAFDQLITMWASRSLPVTFVLDPRRHRWAPIWAPNPPGVSYEHQLSLARRPPNFPR